MLRKCVFLAAALVLIFGSFSCGPEKETPTQPPQASTETPTSFPTTTLPPVTKADLVDALKDLREAMLKKIDSDIDSTAIAFTDVKNYWRTKRWADIFTAPLRILEDTLTVLAKAVDWRSLSETANAALDNSEAAYQVLATVMMLQDLQEVGEKLHYGLDGPTYVSSIEGMLEAADATFVPPSGDDWQNNYRVVIENHLYGITKDTPLVIPRKSTTPQRKNIEFVKGALQVRSSIATTFNDLIAEIENRELPEGFPIDEVIANIKELKKQVIKSMGYSVEVEYKTHFQDPVNTNLGAVGSLYRAFGQIAGKVAEKLEIEQRVEVVKLVETVESAALLYTISYNIPGVEEIKVAQKSTTLAELSIKSYKNTFYTDVEDKFYMLPQEMVLTLPGELSNLWMITDDTNQYLRHLLGFGEVPTPGPDVDIVAFSVSVDAPSPVRAGQTIPITFIICNQGRDPTGRFTTWMFLDNTEPLTFESSQQYFDMALDGNACETVTTDVTTPSDLPAGDYYVVIVADIDREVAETDEYNNTGPMGTFSVINQLSNLPPSQPGNISPINEATEISLTPSLQSSAFSDPDAEDTHAASQWQITTTLRDYSSPIFDSSRDTTSLSSIAIPSGTLNYSTTYYWRVRHQDNHGAWSSYSAETSFTTLASISGVSIVVPDEYPSIQQAVDAANPGDTIIVKNGTYTENVDVNKSHLTIKSESGANSTIVEAANLDDPVFHVIANCVTIKALTVKGEGGMLGPYPGKHAGIYLDHVVNCIIVDNILKPIDNSANLAGICLDAACNNTLSNNTALNCHFAIDLFRGSHNNSLIDNTTLDSACGIRLFNDCSDNTLTGNTMLNNRWNFWASGEPNNVDTSNTVNGKPIQYLVNKNGLVIDSSWDVGYLGIVNCTNIKVKDLTLSNNGQGLLIAHSSDISVEGINVSNNFSGIRLRDSSNNNRIYFNNFLDNTSNIGLHDDGSGNLWNSTEEITYTYNGKTYTSYLGNYWDDYQGSDADGDGIGDTPYSVNSDKDNYPLVEPFDQYEIE